MKWRNVLIVAAITLPLLFVLALAFRLDPRAVPSMLPGKPAPNCQLQSLDGKALEINSFRGKALAINFWATWCVPCEAEHHLLQQAAKIYAGKAEFLGIVYQDTPQAARAYIQKNGGAYPQAHDPGSKCSIEYGVSGVPETFFVNAQGIVQHKHVGPLNPSVIKEQLTPLTQGGHP